MKKTALFLALLLLLTCFVSCDSREFEGIWAYETAEGEEVTFTLQGGNVYFPHMKPGLPAYQRFGDHYYYIHYIKMDEDGRPLEFEVQAHRTWTFTPKEDGTLRLVEEDTEQGTKTEYLCYYVDEIPEESSILFMF